MGEAVSERFIKLIEDEIDKLKVKTGNKINPTETIKDNDGCEYVYSLYSLDHVIHCFNTFSEGILERKKDPKDLSFFNMDSSRCAVLPWQIAFYLRGYIGAISEESMVLEYNKLHEMKFLLKDWFNVNMVDRDEQSKLYQFLCDYEDKWIRELWGNNPDMFNFPKGGTDVELKKAIDDFVSIRVKKKLIAFKEVLQISHAVLGDMFNSVWGFDLNNRPFIKT